MKKPFFSIITGTKNSEKYILRNIESVNSQKFRDYEQIFIDGKSSDKTRDIIRKFVQKDSKRYKLFLYPPKGISDAFNRGIEKSEGQYLSFLNSDDYFYDSKVLENVSAFLTKHKNLDWIYGKINVVEENGKSVGIFPNRKIFQSANKTLLKYFNFVPHQAVFMKREVFEKFGMFDESLPSKMDLDLWLRVLGRTKWRFFDRIIAGYTIRAGSVTSSRKKKGENAARAEKVQKRYLLTAELFLVKIINRVVMILNKTYR